MFDAIEQKFGNDLREARLREGFPLRRFAAMVGVSPSYISDIERGLVKPPSVEVIRKCARSLNQNEDSWLQSAGRWTESIFEEMLRHPSSGLLVSEIFSFSEEELSLISNAELKDMLQNLISSKQQGGLFDETQGSL